MRLPALVGIGLALAACTTFPEIDAAETPGIDNAPYPDLVPIETLLAAEPPRATPELRAGVESRASALRGRASALQGPIVEPETRSRMRTGIDRSEDG
ncbi:hypothetical protein OCH239_13590 [Roseivivax halodurans JCM 10272]|uniref:Uncharacterized protein n=1 Tax=Roseivivax halodurans JCM 10272 TaxID=1449350 RepID=X7EAS9_9RHOB|nr:hypothetical protein [Roseivivax halodurans]ETX13042.1 hypothetical protein OCH239_13590 [Roseivivax halodurans JCM 10272]